MNRLRKKEIISLANQFFDIIILGASKEGLSVYKKLKQTEFGRTVQLISERFPASVEDTSNFITGKVAFISYNHGMMGITLDSDQGIPRIFCHNLIIATGECPKKFPKLGPTVDQIYYNAVDIPEDSKSAAAVVYGDTEYAAKMALTLRKKYKYVYLCTKSFEPKYSYQVRKRLKEATNVAHLPGCQIAEYDGSKGKLTKVTLDTYETITCKALYVDIGRTPDLSAFPNTRYRLFAVNEDSKIITDENCQTLVPKVFAVGAVSTGYNINKEKALIKLLKN
jgi:thioredoxin reductase